MEVEYQIGKKRRIGSVMKNNFHTVWVIAPDGRPVKRHKKKHGIGEVENQSPMIKPNWVLSSEAISSSILLLNNRSHPGFRKKIGLKDIIFNIFRKLHDIRNSVMSLLKRFLYYRSDPSA